tara:strand:- start:2476 stop:4233 length:1758 start_codon:yes stop_codon:yes gene_type:complete
MAKILPAGANVNLNLGDDPFDRLLKTIQTVSQVQGVMNEATLQRDRREAVKEESFQTMMLNTLSSMDKSSMSSVSGAESSLKQMRDQFVAENPGMIDKIDTMYGTALSTTINPVKEIHTNFNRDKQTILNQIEALDKKILNVDEGVALDGSNSKFKEDFQALSKSISRYKARVGEYNSIMPDLAFEMSENVLNATSVLNALPKSLIGIFDDVEQQYYSDLLNGRMTESTFDAALTKYYNDTSGRVTKTTMPLLAAEMKELYNESYLPLDAFTTQIENDLFPKLSSNQSILDQTKPTYYDDDNDTYFIEGTPYGNKKEALNTLNQQKESLKIQITEKDLAYRGYAYETEGNQRSYAPSLNSSGQWAWDKGPSEEEFEFDVPEMVDENKKEISDFIERPEEDVANLDKSQERAKIRLSRYPKSAEKKLNQVNKLEAEIKNFKIEDTSIAKVNSSKIKKLSNLIGKDSDVLNEQDLISLENMYNSDIKEIENLQNQISSERKGAKETGIGLSEGFPGTATEPAQNIKQLRLKIRELKKKWGIGGGENKRMTAFLMRSLKQYNSKKSAYDTALNQYNKIIEPTDASKQN